MYDCYGFCLFGYLVCCVAYWFGFFTIGFELGWLIWVLQVGFAIWLRFATLLVGFGGEIGCLLLIVVV